MMMQKPRYRSSKLLIAACITATFGLLYLITYAACFKQSQVALSFGTLAVPAALAFITTLFGIHRGTGSVDMWNSLKHRPMPRDQPEDDPPSLSAQRESPNTPEDQKRGMSALNPTDPPFAAMTGEQR